MVRSLAGGKGRGRLSRYFNLDLATCSIVSIECCVLFWSNLVGVIRRGSSIDVMIGIGSSIEYSYCDYVSVLALARAQ